MKKRLDVLLVERGLAESRAQAQALVLAGRVPGRSKPGEQVDDDAVLTVVVTNLRLEQRQLRTLGRQVHASMARAIQPFHALEDGDVLFAVSTGAVESDPLLDTTVLGVVASELAWDAVLSVADDPLP